MIYLDNAATTKPYTEVLDSFVKVSSSYFGNPSSLHQLGGEAEKLITTGRKQIAELLGINESEVYFTSGGTESNNLAIKGAALAYRHRGRHMITTSVEHASVLETMKQLETLNFEVTYLRVNKDGRIDLNELEKAIRPDTILVSVMHVNNEVGTIQPIEEIGQLLKKYPKILFHVDDVQGIGKVPLNYHEHHIHLASFSGHKFHGLKGTGFLYIRDGITIAPLLTGGSQESKLRSGTENVGGIVALAKALRLTLEKQASKRKNMLEVKKTIIEGIKDIDEITIHTPEKDSAPHIINFTVKGIKAEVFVHALEEKDIYVSTTSACSSKREAGSRVLMAMGISEELSKSAIRISLSYDHTVDEATKAVQAIKETVNTLKEVMS